MSATSTTLELDEFDYSDMDRMRRDKELAKREARHKAVGESLDSMNPGQLTNVFDALCKNLGGCYDSERAESAILLAGRVARRLNKESAVDWRLGGG